MYNDSAEELLKLMMSLSLPTLRGLALLWLLTYQSVVAYLDEGTATAEALLSVPDQRLPGFKLCHSIRFPFISVYDVSGFDQ